MLMDRLLTPKDDQILYHYCSADTLRSILESRRLRFTDINMMNDAQESRWGYAVFEEAATRLIKRVGLKEDTPTIPVAFFDTVDEILSPIQLIAHPFVSCFSLDGDSLGQWRAYADDGKGFAIGFRASMLRELSVSLLAVEYDKEKQIKEMMGALVAMFFHHNDPKVTPQDFLEDRVLTATYMVAFKHSAFQHENEVRCVHAVHVKQEGKTIKFADPGGLDADGKRVEGCPVSFQVRDNHLSAFLDMPFWTAPSPHPVVEIVLGPKNQSASGNILLYLGGLGYSGINLRTSEIPYR